MVGIPPWTATPPLKNSPVRPLPSIVGVVRSFCFGASRQKPVAAWHRREKRVGKKGSGNKRNKALQMLTCSFHHFTKTARGFDQITYIREMTSKRRYFNILHELNISLRDLMKALISSFSCDIYSLTEKSALYSFLDEDSTLLQAVAVKYCMD
ncbi:hypothetical protein TNCV_4798621 [Trichonephila clavipes]|nr:hypothetical protein TNCV_4798621 [Trichonephila clavipes]